MGIVVMTLEMVGSRILSPYFGASINTWAVLIGIILGSLSLGYWYGGVCADKGIQKKNLSVLLYGVGICLIVIGLFHNIVINAILAIPHITLLWGSLLTSIIFFLIPNILLGMVNPYLAKLMVTSLKTTGSSIGNLSAISTFGNIVGTFSSTFFLIPQFGITLILISIGIMLIILSILFDSTHYLRLKLFSIAILIIGYFMNPSYRSFLHKNGIIDFDTQYGKILIYKYKNSSYLIAGAFGYESMNNSSLTSATPYLPHFDHVLSSLIENPKAALVIGGGTFNLSNYFLSQYPQLKVDSVEIDKKIAEVAYSYFGYKENARHIIYIEDGRTFVNRSLPNTYDFIVNDAYQDLVPPYHLLTQEAVKQIYKTLHANGIYVINIASALEGEKSWLLNSSYLTVSSIFPHVVMIPLEKNISKNNIQNTLLIGLKDPKSPLLKGLQNIDLFQPKDLNNKLARVLTDDYAPVEYNLISITTGRSTFHLSQTYLKVLVDATYIYLLSIGKQLLHLSLK
jgi:spermidine synthase